VSFRRDAADDEGDDEQPELWRRELDGQLRVPIHNAG
jgi:hypothetical protein